VGGAPVYPTVVVSTPGSLRRDSAGSQKHLLFCLFQEKIIGVVVVVVVVYIISRG
jgi:hypothetical protein